MGVPFTGAGARTRRSAGFRHRDILKSFWRAVDPTGDGGRFHDRGASRRTAINVDTEEAAATAAGTRAKAQTALGHRIVTTVLEPAPSWPAGDRRRDADKKNALSNAVYRRASGRDGRVRGPWGDEASLGIEGAGG